MIIKTHKKLILNMYNLFFKFYCTKIVLPKSNFHHSIFTNIYNFYFFYCYYYSFFEMVRILLTIVIMHYIFLISFDTTKIFKV